MPPQNTTQQGTGGAPQALDPTIVNLAKAIRSVETSGQADPYTARGASGEFGAYQYTDGTWAADSKKYLGTSVPLQQATKLQQNEVAYKKLSDLKAAGNNVGQIASIWNSGSPEWEGKTGVNAKGVKYDVPKYVNAVATNYQQLKAGQQPSPQDSPSTVGKEQIVTPQQQADQASAQQTGAFFPAATGDTPLSAGLKAAGNLIPSAFNFAKGAVETLNPINIASNLAQIPGAFSGLVKDSGGVGNALKNFGSELLPTAYKTLVPEVARDIVAGDTEGAQRALVNDPFGQVAPFVFGAKGAAEAADAATGAAAKASMADYVKNIQENTAKGVPIPSGTGTNFGGAIDQTISKVGGVVTKPIGYAFGKAADLAGDATKYGVAKATGLNPDTISQVKANPDAFTPEQIGSASRASLGAEIEGKLGERIDAKAETGKEYQPIRDSGSTVSVDPNFLKQTIQNTTGLELKKGQWTAGKSSSVDSPTDIGKIQRLYDAWSSTFKSGKMTADDFLTLRGKLAKLANYEGIGKSSELESATSRIRGSLNTKYRPQIKGLEELDAQNTAQSVELKDLRKGLIDKDGNLTEAAINRIANATGKGKDALLARLEDISPGIGLKIRQLKAVEDIQNIHKVGTYTKAAIEGGGLVAGLATLNIPLIAGSVAALILTQPEVAVRMIRGYGKYAVPIASKVLEIVKKGGSAVNNLPEAQPTKVLGAFSPRQLTAGGAQ